MKNQWFLSGLLTVWACASVSAQDYAKALKAPAVYTHYHLNPFLINPAHTGFNQTGALLLNFRNHWAGFPDAPKVLTLGLNASPAANMGLGGLIYTENFGVENRFVGQVNYAYHFKFSDRAKIGLGLAANYSEYYLDNAAITDPSQQPSDRSILNAVNGVQYFGADLGLWGEFDGKWRLGLSLPHLMQTRLDNKAYVGDKNFNFVGFVGGIWNLPAYRLVLEPSACLRKISDVPFGLDLNILAKALNELLYGGFTYSYGPSWHRVGFLAGVRVDKLRFLYSYDQSYLSFQNQNSGSHELTLSFDIFMHSTKAKPDDGGHMGGEMK